MSAFLFVWNPNCLSVSEQEFECDIYTLSTTGKLEFVWSIHDYQQVKPGDTAFLYKTGTPDSGICGRGTIVSNVWQGEHWRYDNQTCNYVKISADCLINTLYVPYISMAYLSRMLPLMRWNGGHSGILLSDDYEKRLGAIWDNYIAKFGCIFDGNNAARTNNA